MHVFNIQWSRIYLTASKRRNQRIVRRYWTKARLKSSKPCTSLSDVKGLRWLRHPALLIAAHFSLRWHHSLLAALPDRFLLALALLTFGAAQVSFSQLHTMTSQGLHPRIPLSWPWTQQLSESEEEESHHLCILHDPKAGRRQHCWASNLGWPLTLWITFPETQMCVAPF